MRSVKGLLDDEWRRRKGERRGKKDREKRRTSGRREFQLVE